MSGLDVLGAIASATQLAAYASRIGVLLNDIARGVPRQINEYEARIRQLIETSAVIQQHKSFQLPLINTQVMRTLSEARSLHTFLETCASSWPNKVLRKYCTNISESTEKQLSSLFTKLEGERTTLGLYINLVQTRHPTGYLGKYCPKYRLIN